jgi:spore coat protein A
MALYETLDQYNRITPLLGTPMISYEFMDLTQNPNDANTKNIVYNPAGTPEVWQIFNNTADTHPIHLHQVAFQVLTRQKFTTKLVNLGFSPSGYTTMWGMNMKSTKLVGAPALTVGADSGWKDTIQINPGEVITLRATFDLPGKYVTHCHILSHEEHDMMRYMQIGDVAYPSPGLVGDASGARVTLARTATPAASTLLSSSRDATQTFSSQLILPGDKKDPSLVEQVLV